MSDLTPMRTADEVAQLLGKSATWVRDEARAGRLPHHRIGKSIRFSIQDITEYLDRAKSRDPWARSPRAQAIRDRHCNTA